MGLRNRSGRLIGGLIVIAVGVLLLLGSFNVFAFVWDAFLWVVSILMIVGGGVMLIKQRFRRFIFPLVLIGIGIFILMDNLDISESQYWPVILILIGAGIIFGRSDGRKDRSEKQKSEQKWEFSGTTTSSSTDGDLNVTCTFGEANERVESKDFKGGSATVTFGSAKLDLTDAVVVNRPATLDATVTMGAINIRVPSDWSVSMENTVTAGESEDKRTHRTAGASEPHLVVIGQITMGSLTIED